ncbi:hypothetical protein EVAR_39889_1 [Eumeta japonica]|uniref:Uncharacterized protein n=1 Tax=Eumeta variegata TaxID=151549 RepID=A0A4C1WNJ3_EUMVA|nr:hypothetical protein EVAR_39889_1 [Eumeta japonica]
MAKKNTSNHALTTYGREVHTHCPRHAARQTSLKLYRMSRDSHTGQRVQKIDESDRYWRKTSNKTNKVNLLEKKFILFEARYLRQAKLLCLQATQKESFENELAAFKAALSTPRTSRLRDLALELDISGVLHVKARIAATSGVDMEAKSPPVADGRHPYVRLYVQAVHEQLHHVGVGTMIIATIETYKYLLW